MEDRIKIGNDWYVKELNTDDIIGEITYSRTITYECNKFTLEASILESDFEIFYSPTIEYTNKADREKTWLADNEAYIIGEFFTKFIIERVNSELKPDIGVFLKTSALLLSMNVCTPIKTPTTINKIANNVLYSDAFNFSDIFKPICKPMIDPDNKKETKTRSTDLNCIA